MRLRTTQEGTTLTRGRKYFSDKSPLCLYERGQQVEPRIDGAGTAREALAKKNALPMGTDARAGSWVIGFQDRTDPVMRPVAERASSPPGSIQFWEMPKIPTLLLCYQGL